MRRRVAVVAISALLAVLAGGCGGSPDQPATRATSANPAASSVNASSDTDPDAVAAIGHSGLTGYGSDLEKPGTDERQNSWATGTNPQVDSIYARVLARNPAVEGHHVNVAKDGSAVDDLPRQVAAITTAKPKPDLVLVQSVDNDIRCDGTDAQNYEPFGAALTDVLASITESAPDAHVFLVSQWASVATYADAIKDDPVWVQGQSGSGLCDLFDDAGVPQPQGMAYLQDVVDHYHEQLAASCAQFPSCRYDQGAMQRMTLVPADLTPDASHLSVQGQRTYAELAWAALREAGFVSAG